MLDTLSKTDAFIIAVFFGTLALLAVDYFWNQPAWYFAIVVVLVWPIEDVIFRRMCVEFGIRATSHPIRFAAYIGGILIAAAVAAWVSGGFLQLFHLPSAENLTSTQPASVTTFFNEKITLASSTQTSNPFQPIDFSAIVLVSVAVCIVAYVILNFAELTTRTNTSE